MGSFGSPLSLQGPVENRLAKVVIQRNAQLIQEVTLHPGRVTIGRHPHSDIVIAHRAVSAQHAAISVREEGVLVEDLDSTNGTFVNGVRVSRHMLQYGDRMVVAKFTIDFVAGADSPSVAVPAVLGTIQVQNGPNAGKTLSLTKPVSTLGRPGVQVAAITRKGNTYLIQHVDGDLAPILNGQPAGKAPQALSNGDVVELSGTQMRFCLRSG